MHNTNRNVSLSIHLSAAVNTSGTVSIPGMGWSQNFTLAANTTTSITLPNNLAHISSCGQIEKKAIRIVAQDSIAVFALNKADNSSDAAIIYPISTLGIDYYILTHGETQNNPTPNGIANQQFMIVAPYNNTVLEITPTAPLCNNWQAGNTYTVTLQAGELLRLRSEGGDLSGTRVRALGCAAAPFAVFAGHVWTNLGGTGARDHLVEQMPPISFWGQQFVFSPFAARQIGDIGKILAAANDTRVIIGNNSPIVLQCGQTYTFEVPSGNNGIAVKSNKPILCGHFNKGQSTDLNTDPFFILLPPVDELAIKEVTISGMNLGAPWTHFTSIVTARGNESNITCTCGPLQWLPVIGNDNFVHARSPIPPGNSTIRSAGTGFIASVYGNADIDSYGYAGAASIVDAAFQIQGPRYACKGETLIFRARSLFEVDRFSWLVEGVLPTPPTSVPYLEVAFPTCGEKQIISQMAGVREFCDSATKFCVIHRVQVFETVSIEPLPIDSLPCAGAPFRLPFRISGVSCQNQSYRWQINYTLDGQPQSPLLGAGNGEFSFPIPALSQSATLQITSVILRDFPAAARCSISNFAPILINVRRTAVPNVIVNTSEACVGQAVVFSITNPEPGVIYTWNFSGNAELTSASGAGPIINKWNAPGVVTTQLIATPLPPCTAVQVSLTVKILPKPSAQFSGPDSICTYAAANFTLTSSVQPGTIYFWRFPGGNPAQSEEAVPPPVRFSAAGNYTIELIAIQDGCSSNLYTRNLKVIAPPSRLPLRISSPPYCTAQPISLEYLGPRNNNTQVLWYFGQNAIPTSAQGPGPHRVAFNFSPTPVTIELKVIESTCARDTLFSISIIDTPKVKLLTSARKVCTGSLLTVEAVPEVGSNVTNYNWLCEGCQATPYPFTTAGPFFISWQRPGITQVVLRAENQGCVANIPVSIEVLPTPTADFLLSDSVCVGAPFFLTYTGNAPLNEKTIFHVICDNCTHSMHIGATPNPLEGWQVETEGTHSIRLIVEQEGCRSERVASFKSYFLPLSLSSNTPICSGQNLILTAQSISDVIVFWEGPQNFSAMGRIIEFPNSSPSRSGKYVAQGIYNQCRTEKKSVDILVRALPSPPWVIGDTILCNGKDINLQAFTSSQAQIFWKTPEGKISYINPLIIPNAGVENSGKYAVIAVQSGCTSETTFYSLRVIQAEPIRVEKTILERCGIGPITFTVLANPSYSVMLSDTAGILLQWKRTSPFIFSLFQPLSSYIVQGRSPEGCTTSPIRLQTQVHPLPAPPSVTSIRTCGAPPGVITFTPNFSLATSNFKYLLYEKNQSIELPPLAISEPLPPYQLSVLQMEREKEYHVWSVDKATGCTSAVPASVVATFVQLPTLKAEGSTRCGGGRLTFTLLLENGVGDSVFLYAEPTQAQLLAKWNLEGTYSLPVFTTPIITQTTTFYLAAQNKECGFSPVVPLVLEVIPLLELQTQLQYFPNAEEAAWLRVMVRGGFPPYRYQIEPQGWQTEPLIGPLLPGQYLLRVADSRNCIAEKSINVVAYSCSAPRQLEWRSANGIHTTPLYLQWSSVEGAKGYRVSLEFLSTIVTYYTEDTVLMLNGLLPNQTYKASVQTICTSNQESKEKATLRVQTIPCLAVQDWNIQISSVQVESRWRQDSLHSFYWLLVQRQGRNVQDTILLTQPSFTLTNLQGGSTYILRLIPLCAGGSIIGEMSEKIITLNSECFTPSRLRYENAALHWQVDLPGEGEVMLRYRLYGTNNWIYINTSSPWLTSGLQVGRTYEAQVRKICELGKFSSWSPSIIFTP
ncbi:MAG: IgGFc-binding protein [Bacteroidia bacterium]|nr:IgGFc-binding protein [Bacteroidia bacterium]